MDWSYDSLKRLGRMAPIASLFLLLAGCQLDDSPTDDTDAQLLAALTTASDGRGITHFMLPDEDDFYAIPQDPRNRLTRAKVDLGKLLFHETALGVNPRIPSNDKRYSCASCHHAGGGFQANLIQGIGEGGLGYGVAGEGRVPDPTTVLDSIDVQQIRTPSALNIAYQECILWNGQFGGTGPNMGTEVGWIPGKPTFTNYLGYEGTETQAIAGLKVHRMDIDSAVLMAASPDYAQLFAYAFPEVPVQNRYDREHAGLAIAAYERTLLANQSPFQKWLRGDHGAMKAQEKQGAILFFSKARCYVCHNGPALNSMGFYGLGMPNLIGNGIYGSNPDDAVHKGRGGFTQRQEDMFKYKVPQLYNLKDSPFYGHGGNFTTVEAVVKYKNTGQPLDTQVPSSQISDEFRPLHLSDEEVSAIATFLEKSLYDPMLQRYEPSRIPSGQCFPNNDLLTRYDRGCD